MRIKQLPQEIINQIAAGEVVERPASVVKELLENALDAQATVIKIDIEKGGSQLIRVTDNGIGISKENIPFTILAHATSKISSVNDLQKISTMGFRGEALSSISSVSLFELKSKPSSQQMGYRIYNKGDEFLTQEVGMPHGTIVSVQNLFYNVPARQKFLKSQKTEFSHILSIIMEYALIHPSITFIISHNQKETVHLPQTNNPFERVKEIMGQAITQYMIPVQYEDELISISGFITKPNAAQQTNLNQHLFVNYRSIKDVIVNKAIRQGLQNLIAHDKYPAYFLHIQIRPDLVDVNVHPRKTEVKFMHNGLIFQSMQQALWQAFNQEQIFTDKAGEFLYSHQQNAIHEKGMDTSVFSKKPSVKSAFAFQQKISSFSTKPQETFVFEAEKANEHIEVLSGHQEKEPFTVLGQVAQKFIVVEYMNTLLLVDQHAAHEGLMYKQLTDQKTRNTPRTQQLLIPLTFELSTKESNILEQCMSEFTQLGFSIDELGKNTFSLTGIPPELGKYNSKELIQSTIHDLSQEEHILKSIEKKFDLIIKYASCRYAIMFHDTLSLEEMRVLIQDVFTHKVIACAHGRPIFYEIDIDDLAKKFHRH